MGNHQVILVVVGRPGQFGRKLHGLLGENYLGIIARKMTLASSDLEADVPTLLTHIATRWDIEVLFADTKELLGLDHYQLMSALAIQRFWALVMVAYFYLDTERDRLQRRRQPVSPSAMRRAIFSSVTGVISWIGSARDFWMALRLLTSMSKLSLIVVEICKDSVTCPTGTSSSERSLG